MMNATYFTHFDKVPNRMVCIRPASYVRDSSPTAGVDEDIQRYGDVRTIFPESHVRLLFFSLKNGARLQPGVLVEGIILFHSDSFVCGTKGQGYQ